MNAFRPATLMVICLAAASATLAQSVPAPRQSWNVIVRGEQSEPERLATVDLQRYLAETTGSIPELVTPAEWEKSPRAALIVGTLAAQPLLKSIENKPDSLGEQGYCLLEREVSGTRVVIAAGATSAGAVNAIYGLLRELGFGFYLGSEAIPERLPPGLSGKTIIRVPRLVIRGVLPWYNFFDSPTVWDPIDHRAFADQLVRMGANFVGFHTYDYEPFAGYEESGEMKYAKRLLNTASPTWGTHPLPAREFAFGTNLLFADDFFGAASTQGQGDAAEAIRRELAIMREALDYAKRRGLHPCIGFEMSGDPTKPADREVFLKRLNHVLDQYPAIDYVWLWQVEAQGPQGYRTDVGQQSARFGPRSPLDAYAVSRREVFRRIVDRTTGERPFFDDSEAGRHARAAEGARLEQFAQLACRALEHRNGPPKLIISGWGGDERLLSAEYYDGLDRLLPGDVVFASLDHIVPRLRVDAIYHELPAPRQRWPIPWLEYDGDQWHPQPYVHVYEAMMRDLGHGGSQGALGIHWRTRDVEENFAYLVEYAWNPEVTAESFFRDLARRCYPERIADRMAEIHSALDKLGYRWVGGGGESECGTFNWGPGEEAKAAELTRLRQQVAGLLNDAGRNRPRLQWLINEMDWVLHFRKAELAAVKARDLLAQAGSADPEQRKALATQALAALDAGDLAEALHAYARRISTRGEHGVLATINTKAVVAWRGLRGEALRVLGRPAELEPATPWNPEPQILMPRLIGSTAADQPLELTPVVLGGGKAYVHYRRVGEQTWTTAPLQTLRGWVQRAEIPADRLVPPAVQVAFSWKEGFGGELSRTDPAATVAFGPVCITVLPKPAINTQPPSRKPAEDAPALVITRKGSPQPRSCAAGGPSQAAVTPVEITWNDTRQADYFRVYRNDQPVCDTAVATFPDIPMAPEATYRVEAWRDGQVIAKSKPHHCAVPDEPISAKTELQIKSNRGGVAVRWPDLAGKRPTSQPAAGLPTAPPPPAIYGYQLERLSTEPDSRPQVLARVRVTGGSLRVYQDRPPPGRWIYKLQAINAAGHAFPVATTDPVSFQAPAAATPVIDWPLTMLPARATVTGEVRFGQSGASFGGGYVSLPDEPGLDLDAALTVCLEFQADRSCLDAMPVLLCHGLWQTDGWFVQILNGSLIVRTSAGDATGPHIEPGRWYKIRFVFDGLSYRLFVDGQAVPQPPQAVSPRPATRRLIIGQYESPAATYAFIGFIRNLRIYNDAVLE